MSAEVYFENIKQQIRAELRKAKDYVFIAVAWFTDDELFNEIVNLSAKGIQVQLIINEDVINLGSGLDYSILFKNGGMVYFIESQSSLMHNKFCIIDKRTVLNGSYNWTRKASSNLENIIILRDDETSSIFLNQFEILKNQARKYFTRHNRTSQLDNLNFEQLIIRAKKRKENGNYLTSLIDLKKAIELCPEREIDLLFDIAFCQAELNDDENAIANYSRYFEFEPTSAASLNNRGLLYEKSNRLKQSYEDYSKAIEIDGDDFLYYKNRAHLYSKFIKTHRNYKPIPPIVFPISSYSSVEEWKKSHDEYDESRKYWMRQNIEKILNQCVEDYLMVIKLNPESDHGTIYSEVGEIYYQLGDYVKSIEFYSKAVNLKHEYHYGYYSRGWSKFLLNKFEEAIKDIEYALKLSPREIAYKEAIRKIKRERMKPKNWFN